jgi:hypothetical protein
MSLPPSPAPAPAPTVAASPDPVRKLTAPPDLEFSRWIAENEPSPADLSGALLPSPLSANELIKDLYLYLLNLNKPLPLVLQQVIHLLMQVADLKLSLEVNPVVVL